MKEAHRPLRRGYPTTLTTGLTPGLTRLPPKQVCGRLYFATTTNITSSACAVAAHKKYSATFVPLPDRLPYAVNHWRTDDRTAGPYQVTVFVRWQRFNA